MSEGVPAASGVRAMMAAAQEIPDAVRLEAGQPDWSAPAAAVEAGRRALEGRMGYAPSFGIEELRAEIAARAAARTGLEVSPDMVVVTAGAVTAVALLVVHATGAHRPLLVPDVSWPNVNQAVRANGARRIHYPLDEHGPDLDALASLDVRDAVLFLNTPSNPTGVVIPADRLRDVLDLARLRGWFVIADEVYEDLVWSGDFPRAASIAGGFEDLATVSSVSKSFAMPGYRVGWLVAERELVAELKPLVEGIAGCGATSSQVAALAALREGDAHLGEIKRRLAERAEVVDRICSPPGLTAAPPRAGMFGWLRVGDGLGGDFTFALALLRDEHVATAPGIAFGPGGHDHLRVALACPPEELEPALQRLVGYWQAYEREQPAPVARATRQLG